MAELSEEAGRSAELARAHESRSAQLEEALTQTREACFARDRRIAWLEGELDLSRAEAASTLRGLAALGTELEALRISARGNATRIRLEALREAGAVAAETRDLGNASEEQVAPLLRAVEAAIERVANDWAEEEVRVEDTEELARISAEADGAGEIRITRTADAPAPEPAAAAPPPAGSRRVTVDVGPFKDFSQLVAFEDAANAIDGAGEISIRRFSGGRASIDVDLSGPVDLLAELESRFGLGFEVRTQEEDAIVLDLA